LEAIISVIIFAAVMILIMTEKVHRTTAALTGAVLLMLTHILTVKQAIGYIDFNTIGVLLGMMIFVAIVKKSGLFEYVAIKTAKKSGGNPWRIMVLFMIITAILSAFLDNVTTVLLIGPMTITVTRMLDLDPVPFLITQALASNIGGTATLIGDPPNIMIGSAAGLGFMDFINNDGLAIVLIFFAVIFALRFKYGGDRLGGNKEAISKMMMMDEKKAIEDPVLLTKSLVMIALVVLGFILHQFLGLESSTIALTAAVVMMLIGKQDIDKIIADIEWPTLLFFIGLFIIVGGMVETGIINILAKAIISFSQGHTVMLMLILLWASALLSSILDNIPFVATLIPLIIALGNDGMDIAPLWWAISLGACLGGNGTLIGASANVVISGISNRYGHPISFKDFTKVGFPIMLLTMVICSVYLVVRYGGII